jgi:hypothetical protein
MQQGRLRTSIHGLFLGLIVTTFAAAGLAQNITGSILGTVTDPSEAAVAGAEVEVLNRDTNQAARLKTNEAGLFEAVYLRPGSYRVTVSATGFKTSLRDNLTLRVEDRLRLDFQLEVGDASTTVTVAGEAPLVETENASLGQVVSTRVVQDIPIRGRNIFDLVGLAAGVQVNPRAIGGTASTGDNSAPLFVQSDISINGGRFRTNDFMVDGVSVMLPENNNYAFAPSPDGTQEFKVLTNSFGPQFGRSGGGTVNVVTRGGSNDFHGTVYEFFRNDRLRANNFFANARGQARGKFTFNQFGAAVGGPVIKNKTFFFFDYMGHRERVAGGAGIATVPTTLERSGDFSQTRNRNGDPVLIYNPFSTRSVAGGFVRDPYPGNVIPTAAQSRVGRNLAAFYPDANTAGEGPARINNLLWAPKNFINSNQWSARLDHRFSERLSLFGRVTRNTGDSGGNGPYNNIAEPVLGIIANRVVNGVINTTAVLSPSRILNLRAGVTRRFEGRTPLASGKVNLTELGFSPAIAAAAQEQLFPTTSIANYTGLGAPGGDRIRRGNTIYTVVAEQTEIRGRHTFVYGADLRMYDQTPFQGGTPSGSYSFGLGQTQGPNPLTPSLTAGHGLASLLTGFGSGSINLVPALAIRNMYYALFFNDDIKFGRLTINAGMRWDYEQPRTERYNRFGNFDFNAPFPVQVPGYNNPSGVIRFAGRDGLPRGQFDPVYTNFGPRLGLAYRLGNDTVIRSGYAIFFAPRFGTTSGQGFGAPGFDLTTPWVASLDGVTPLNLLDNPFPTGLLQPPTREVERLQMGLGVTIMDRGNRSNIYNQQWNLTVQHQLRGGFLLEAAYAGNKGTRLPISIDFNAVDPRFQSLGAQLNEQVPNPFFGTTTVGALAQRTVSRLTLLRPYPHYGTIGTFNPAVAQNIGSSIYHSAQLRVEKRFAGGNNFVVAYTNSKLIDDGSGRIFGETAFTPPVQNQYNLRAERSLSEGDISQRLVISHSVELPFGKGRKFLSGAGRGVDLALGGWSLSGVASWNTGFPLALTSIGNSGVGSAVLRPNSTGQSANLSGSPQSRLNRYFDISQFTTPPAFTFGNVARTLPDVRGPARRNYDVALQKSFLVREPLSVVFRAEAFNLTNTPYFFTPGEGLGSPTFGVITAASGERTVQFSLKVVF